MVMDYLAKRVEEAHLAQIITPPDWTSDKNASLKAWQYTEELRQEKELYIQHHSKTTDFLTQKTYQIKGSDIAKALFLNRSSLMNTSSYSNYFREYLDSVNKKLAATKEKRVRNAKKTHSRGTIRNRKDELVSINASLKKRVADLEAQKTEDIVAHAFDQLPLPVKRKLGIE